MKSIRIRGSSGGFSLVELLVGVVICGLLVGLAVPAVQGALVRGRQSVCSSNLKQIGQGITLYAQEQNGALPSTTCLGGESWIVSLQPYLGENFDRVRICPVDPKRNERLKYKGTSYLINDQVDVAYNSKGVAVPGSLSSLLRMDQGSKRILLFIAADTKSTGPTEDHVHSFSLGRWTSLLSEIKPDAYAGSGRDRTRGSANYLFADTHVQSISASEIKRIVDGKTNIATQPL
ncbi:MAG: prepilin-type N-terminal cleavage/methylation domain-containing protein [Verrucomicrobia bacterium]|nr:prepilin-type N-terminal cleavage/methylation domain-containing protein [Verrucomicrobiota bacterium]